MAVLATAYGPAIYRNVEDQEKATAAAYLGTSNLLWFFYVPSILGISAIAFGDGGTGARTFVTGLFNMSTGATAGSYTRLIGGNDGSTFSKTLRSGQNWYISGRLSLQTAIDATAKLFIGGGDAAGAQLAMAGDGASSTTNFMLSGPTGTAINSGVAIDTVLRTHRGWRNGSTTYYSIDSGAAVTGNVDILTDHSPFAYAYNGGSAVTRTMRLEWFCAASPAL